MYVMKFQSYIVIIIIGSLIDPLFLIYLGDDFFQLFNWFQVFSSEFILLEFEVALRTLSEQVKNGPVERGV